MTEPAHKILINRYINWHLVEERLERYKNISKFYTLENLKNCSNKAPYFCHYLSWRLGTWKDEQLFKFFDALLGNATKLQNWSKARIPQGCEFENFWSFVWELQVAQLFSNYLNTNVEWKSSGPDLKVDSSGGKFFVECTIYRKSFGLEEFINELLGHIHPWIEAKHVPFLDYSLPNNAIEPFLDELFQPFLDDIYLQEIIKKSETISPILLPSPKSIGNFYLFIKNEDAQSFNPDQPWIATGLPEYHLAKVMEEVFEKKKASNELMAHRPNLLAVNLLLGVDFQLATALRNVPTPNLGNSFDAVFLAVCGIDEIPSLNNRGSFFHSNHPIKDLITP